MPDKGLSQRQGRGADAASQFSVFAFLLALAALIHQARLEDWTSPWPDIAVSLAAVAVLLRPSSVGRLLLLLALELVAVAIDMPAVVNHSLLLALTALGVFVALGFGLVTRRPGLWDRGALYEQIAPVLRIEVVAVYLLAALAKVNESFLDPGLSCGVAMTQDLLARLPGQLYAPWMDQPAIWGTIAIELLLPLLLVVRRTRLVALFLGIGFHTVLAAAGHVPFSGFAMAFYWLFAPDDMPERLRRLRDRRPRLRQVTEAAARLAGSRLALPVLAAAWLGVAALVAWGPDGVLSTVHATVNALFMVYAAGLALVLILCVRQGRPFTFRPGAFRVAHPIWILAPALVILNGLTPYLGLKSQSAFTMYSNLQTEEGRWNHTLVPEDVRAFGFLERPVRVIASDDPELAAAAREGRELAWLAFTERTSSRPDAAVTYERAGSRAFVKRIADDPELSTPPPRVAGALLAFRDIPPPERNDCRSRRPYTPGQGS